MPVAVEQLLHAHAAIVHAAVGGGKHMRGNEAPLGGGFGNSSRKVATQFQRLLSANRLRTGIEVAVHVLHNRLRTVHIRKVYVIQSLVHVSVPHTELVEFVDNLLMIDAGRDVAHRKITIARIEIFVPIGGHLLS